MDEQNKQNLENQDLPETTEEITKTPKKFGIFEKILQFINKMPKKVKMAVLIGAPIAVILLTLVVLFASGVFDHIHEWRFETIKVATCTEKGISKQICDGCGESSTYESYYKDHEYGEYEHILTNCLIDSKRVRSCKVCGYEDSYTVTADGSHNFWSQDWVATENATCTTDGIEERTCRDCGEKETRVIPASHKYSNGICTVCNRGVINIILPDTPITVYDYKSNGSIDETCKITSIELKSVTKQYNGTYELIFVWAGEKTYDDNGNNYSSSVGFAYKLYDSDGYVVKSGSEGSVGVCVGEKFRDQELKWSYADLDPNETYTLEILNLD